MKQIVLQIGGMTCSACQNGLEKYLAKQKGIIHVNVNLILSIATIEYENITKKEIERYISNAGFECLGEMKRIETTETSKPDKIKLISFGIFLVVLWYISMGNMLKLPPVPIFNHQNPIIFTTGLFCSTILYLWYGYDILKSGITNLLHRIPNMDTLVMFSVLFSFGYSIYGYINILMGKPEHIMHLYFDSTCMVIYFIKLGRFIENRSKDKTKEAIKKLVQVTPKYAILKEKGIEKKISIDEVKQEDLLIGKAGEKIAVDGIVEQGKTYVDESFITGESAPILKEKGNRVIAGSICYDGYIEYRAKKVGKDSTISEIVKLIIETTNTKNKMQKLADRISGYFVPTILIIALFTGIIQTIMGGKIEESILHTVTILTVACPCALGLAVPLVVIVSMGLCAKKGLFLANSEVLEKAKNIDTIVFDKTGTLTFGKLKIYQTFNYSKYKTEELLNIVSNIEKKSSHPIQTAFQIKTNLEVKNFKTINGIGITAEINKKKYQLGNQKIIKNREEQDIIEKDYNKLIQNGCSIIYVVEDNIIIGLIGVKDIIRTELKNTMQELKQKKIDVIMLTGDNEQTSNIIAKELGITKVIANVLPKDKANHIKNLKNQGKQVIMVGDGMNDAPALVEATVGVSVNDGTDIAMDCSDVILMNNNMQNILDLIDISKQSYRAMKQNLFWAFFYNTCMIPIAMGIFPKINMTPAIASIAMILSSLTVVLNSLRFGRVKK